jgi:ribosomal protein L12E/L44/L45/RPP1/RPP2
MTNTADMIKAAFLAGFAAGEKHEYRLAQDAVHGVLQRLNPERDEYLLNMLVAALHQLELGDLAESGFHVPAPPDGAPTEAFLAWLLPLPAEG